MKVGDIMKENVISIRSDQTVHEAVEIMKKHDIHQLVVMEDSSLKGIIQIKRVLSKNFDEKTKINAVLSRATTIQKNEEIGKAAGMFLKIGLRALPVADGEKIVGIVSEIDFLKALGTDIDVNEFVSACVFGSIDDNIGIVKNIMNDHNISRVPLMDENGRIQGIVDILDIAKIYSTPHKFESTGKKRKGSERQNIDEILARNVMRPAVVLKKDSSSEDIIKKLRESEEVIIENGTCSILTPKDLLELLISEPERGVYVQITGLKHEDSLVIAKLDQTVNEFVQKMGKMVSKPEFLFIHVDHYHKDGKRIKYSIRARFKTSFGLFVSKSWGWNPMEVIQESMGKLEREVIKKHDKIKDVWKKSGQMRKEKRM